MKIDERSAENGRYRPGHERNRWVSEDPPSADFKRCEFLESRRGQGEPKIGRRGQLPRIVRRAWRALSLSDFCGSQDGFAALSRAIRTIPFTANSRLALDGNRRDPIVNTAGNSTILFRIFRARSETERGKQRRHYGERPNESEIEIRTNHVHPLKNESTEHPNS